MRAALTLLLLLTTPALAQDATLSPDDAALLDGLRPLLGDPSGSAGLVAVMEPEWGSQGRHERSSFGWLRGEGQQAQVVFPGGLAVPAPAADARQPLDFVAACTRVYGRGERVDWLDPTPVGYPRQHPLVHAVWLRALGQDALAARALATLREDALVRDDLGLVQLRTDLSGLGVERVQGAFVARDDAAALGVAEWLTERGLTPPPVPAILAELRRRQATGRLGQPPPERPQDFAAWPLERRSSWLLAALDELHAPGSSGDGPTLLGLPLVRALLDLGDAAVPALLGALEHDERLTRFLACDAATMGGAGPVTPGLGLLSVRDVAAELLLTHWRTAHPGPAAEQAWVSSPTLVWVRDPAAAAAALRAYWERYGGRPELERWLALLGAPAGTTPAQRLEAVQRLVSLGAASEDGRLRLSWAAADARVAPAILAQLDPAAPGRVLDALVRLGDLRIARELAARARQASGRLRRALAFAAFRLGAPEPWLTELEAVRRGQSAAPPALDEVLRQVEASGVWGAGALAALTRPAHPWRERLVAWALRESAAREPAVWLRLRLLRQLLEDRTPTGGRWVVAGSVAHRWGGGSPLAIRLEQLGGADACRASAVEERRDQAASALTGLLLGVPRGVHPLVREHEAALIRLEQVLDRFRWRALTSAEREALGDRAPLFAPLLTLGAQPASAADVAAGRALFHLPDSVGPAWVDLPALAVAKDEPQARLLIVQGETTADGQARWGALGGAAGIQVLSSEQLQAAPVPLYALAHQD